MHPRTRTRFPDFVFGLATVLSAAISTGFSSQQTKLQRPAERVAPDAPVKAGAAAQPTASRPQIVLDPAVVSARGGSDILAVAASSDVNLANLIASDLKGNVVAVDKLADGKLSLDAQPNQWVVLKPQTTELTDMRVGVQWLPGVCIPPPGAAGASPGDTLSSYTSFSTVPVVWDATADAYRLRANIGVARNGDQKLGGSLGTKASVKLSFIGVSGIEPSELFVEQLGIDGEQPVDITFARTDAPDARLVVRSNLAGEQPFAMDVRPRIEVRPRRNPILGLGLEETVVVIECVQAHGASVTLGEPTAVTVECAGAREQGVDDLEVADNARQAQFSVRSMSLGDAHVVATARTATQEMIGSVTLRQQMPWGQVLGALIGGALGGFARRFVKGARRATTGRRVVEGVIVASVAFVAGVLGVGYLDLPAAIVATVAGAFLTGALAGFVGVSVLEALTKARTQASR